MKTAFILAFILLLLSFHSNAQQTIDKLNVNQLKLPKESANKALILDGAGQVKSSSTITDTELGYLEGLSDTLVNLLSGKANDSDVVKLSGNQSVDGVKTFTGKLVASSTVNGSIPCPVMTEAQRDLFTPVEGDCVYNSDTLKLNVFDGSVWKDVGGAGGISLWLTANPYNVNDIVIESDKIYRCLIAHTSGTFATDLGAGNWGEVSQGLTSPVALADGGTGLSITPVAGSIVYVDADSFEQLAPGSAGQILQSNGSSAPSWVDKTEYVSPNNLETPISSTQILLESGNKNILTNPSFENTTFESGGWVNSAGVFTENFANKVDGAKSARLVLSSQIMSLSQSSVLYQSSFADGVQGLASVWLKSDVALKVCAVQAGVVSTSLCVDVQANNKWGLYKVPFILGVTSNGISIASTGAVTGTVYIDDAFVGAASLTQNMNACNDVSCETVFSAKVSATGVVSEENQNFINGNCVVTSTSLYTCSFNSSIYTVAPNCTVSNSNAGLNLVTRLQGNATSSQVVIFVESTANSPVAGQFNIICQKQGADFTAAKQLSNGNTYSSTNADTDWASCNFSTLAWQGLGTVTSSLKCKRQGSELLIEGNFVSGTTSASEARIPLPIWNGAQLSTSNSQIIPSIGKYGDTIRDSALLNIVKRNIVIVEPSVNYLNLGQDDYSSSTNPFSKLNGSSVLLNNQKMSINARIPIDGWQNSNIIIGQFNGLESCTSTLDCTDVFSAKVSAAGVVSDENAEWINGNASKTATGDYTITFNSSIFTVAPNCTALPGAQSATSGSHASTISLSNSSFRYLITQEAGTEFDSTINIVCQKQGVDYIGKTAKAVASDQNVRNPGVTNAISFSFAFGTGSVATACTSSPCSALDQSGSMVSSVTRTGTGDYVLNFNQTINKLACTAKQISGAAGSINIGSWCSNCTSATLGFRNTSGGAQDASASVVCVGNL